MPLSTSSSSTRVPPGRWLLTWCLVSGIVLSVVAGWELYIRGPGLSETAVTDTAELWIRERERAASLGDDAIILVGASRMQMGIDLRVMKQFTTGTPVQLAISASPFMPVLEHLANDASITGTVIVSLTVADISLFSKESRAELWLTAYDEFKAGKTRVFYQSFEDFLRRQINSILMTFDNNARPQQLLLGATSKGYVRTLPDRSQQADYSGVDRELAYQRRIELVRGDVDVALQEVPDFDERIRYLESLIKRIAGRGGTVILVRLPSAGRIREIEDARYPRSVYWDRLAARISARTLHHADYSELSGFDFPDGVHIDVSDQAAYTQALSRLLFDDPSLK